MADWDKKIEEETFSSEDQKKLVKDDKKKWDLFYKRNANDTILFKHRHWTVKEFEFELKDCIQVVDCLLNKWFQENYIHSVRLQNIH